MSELTKINGFDVLPFSKDQISGVADTYMAVFNAAPWNEKWTVTSATDRLNEVAGTPNCMGLVTLDAEGSVIGFAIGVYETWDAGRQFYLKELGVRPDLQQQGIGSTMLEEITKDAFNAGASQVALDTDHGIPAEGIFSRRGFMQERRVMMFRKNPALG